MPFINARLAVCLLLFVVYSSCEVITFISPEVIRDIGDSAELNCTVDNPNDFSVLWSKKAKNQDPVPLSIGNHLTVKDRRFNLTSDGKTYTLHIYNIEFSDTASYECQVLESSTERHTKTVELLVKHTPRVDNIEINPLPVTVNGSAELKCFVSGYPRPSIIWKRENDAVMPAGGNSFIGQTLRINEVKSVDRGLYYCIADNGVGVHRSSANFDVEFPPTITVPRPKVAQALDYDVEIECRVEGYPAPSIQWRKGDVFIENDGNYHIRHTAANNDLTSSVLHIQSIEKDQYGDYFCVATNKLGSAERRLNVFAQTYSNPHFASLQRNSAISAQRNVHNNLSNPIGFTTIIIILNLVLLK